MAVLPIGFGSEEGGYRIERSLRFNSSDSAYMNRTPASAGSLTTWTWSGWFKRSALGARQTFFSGGPGGSDTAFTQIVLWDDDKLRVGGWSTNWRITTQVFRDVSAWMHLVVVWDTGNATAADKVRVYVNGSRVTAFDTSNSPTNSGINQAAAHAIGRDNSDNTKYFSGYMAEVQFVGGSALDPTSFGEFNSDTGVWQPKKYTGTYGTNGFYLNFSDNSGTTSTTLGKDSSGNGNNWTPNNFSVTAGAGNDSLVDTPTNYGTDTGAGGEVRGNYATLNPLNGNPATGALTNGNLETTSSGNGEGYWNSTIALPNTGKWYWEFVVGTGGSGIRTSVSTTSSGTYSVWLNEEGRLYINGVSQGIVANSYTSSDVMGVSVDVGALEIKWYKNGSLNYTYTYTAQTLPMFPFVGKFNTANVVNFGQRPFAYTAPSGFKALCTQNLPEPTIKKGGEHFNTVLYTGTGSARSVTGVGFQPDFVWIKERNSTDWHALFDAVRGVHKNLYSNTTNAEDTQATSLTAFNSDGFSVGSAGWVNGSGDSIVAWNWKANGAGSSNTAGTITSTVSVNTTSGFSIVTYTGTGANATVGHGLGVAPAMIIWKNRNATASWVVWHTNFSAIQYIYLNLTNAVSSSSGSTVMNSTLPTSSVFSLGTYSDVNGSTNGIVAYCFAPVAGYSAFGSYTGNGSADGPFVYTGFRPALIIRKRTDNIGDWIMMDDKRNTYNLTDNRLLANSSNAEVNNGNNIDILSNGWKERNSDGYSNASGGTYIYMAFAESPVKYSLGR